MKKNRHYAVLGFFNHIAACGKDNLAIQTTKNASEVTCSRCRQIVKPSVIAAALHRNVRRIERALSEQEER